MAKAAAVDPVLAILATAEKKYNLSVGSMDAVAQNVRFVSTGNLAIDTAIGGGIPQGRSVELYGPPSCGKTTTALQHAVVYQKIIKAGGSKELGIGPDDRIVYFDYEQAMDKKYAKALGLDTEHPSFLFTQPDTLEDGSNLALDLIKTGKIRLVIFDSVASMTPSSKMEAEVGKSLPMVQAKLMKDFGVLLNVALAENNATALFLNHEQEKVNMGGGGRPGMPPAKTTPGGTALKYFASVRVQYAQIRQNRGDFVDPLTQETVQIPISTDVKVKVVKNKVAPPFREAVVRVRFGRGFDNFWTALQVLIANKKIMYSAGMYYFHNLVDVGGAPEWMPRAATGTNRPFIKGEKTVFNRGDKYNDWRDLLIKQAEQIAIESADNLLALAPIGGDEEEDEDEDGDDVDALLDGVEKENPKKVKL